MEKIVENCPWIDSKAYYAGTILRYCVASGKRCTGPDCAPAYWAKAMFNIPLTELEDNQE